MPPIDIFQSLKADEQLHESFKMYRDSPVHRGGRDLMNEVFNEMPQVDNHFVEQFQTQGFEARLFELGLYAFLRECNLSFKTGFKRPDFIVSDGKMEICIEATTSNPCDGLKLKNLSTPDKVLLSNEEIEQKTRNELPIKMGQPLYDKLMKQYWKLPQCKDKPIILAIQMAHEPFASSFPVISLVNYLYGFESFQEWTENGELVTKENRIHFHHNGKKIIPSHFFGQEGTEHISGVLFSNQLTASKFVRMAYQLGYQADELEIIRRGMYMDLSTGCPKEYEYQLGAKNALQETWTQGLTLILNPNANEPVPPLFFSKLTTLIYWDAELKSCVFDFYPLNSISQISQKISVIYNKIF